jgi:alkanesulfonate monooxygenase SsuD/methylene tetrahydromethanopterin reductase-like flavin-dependent oxidoreductase (luciferase family)
MKVGITLPQFRDEADSALDAARHAEAQGIDGVFCFDHLWPIGQPDRPVLSSTPLLGALVASTSTIAVGTLVARIGLLPDEMLVAVLSTVSALSNGRLIAGIGTGDRLSRAENEAYGLPFESADRRRARLAIVASAVRDLGIPVWVGAGLPQSIELARSVGAAVNLWEAATSDVAQLAATGIEVTWAGPIGETAPEATERLQQLSSAGATWAVCAWPDSIEMVAEAADSARAGP